MLVVAQEQVSWNEAAAAYAAEYVYRCNAAEKSGRPTPEEKEELEQRVARGRRYLVAKLWDQMKTRKLFVLVEPEEDGLAPVVDLPKADRLYRITEKGVTAYENPSAVPYMRYALQGRRPPKEYPPVITEDVLVPEDIPRQPPARLKEPEPGSLPRNIDDIVEWDFEHGAWRVKKF